MKGQIGNQYTVYSRWLKKLERASLVSIAVSFLLLLCGFQYFIQKWEWNFVMLTMPLALLIGSFIIGGTVESIGQRVLQERFLKRPRGEDAS